MSRSWGAGSTRRWRRIRAAVLHDNQVTNGGRCTIAMPGVCTGQADCVHHTQGRAVTGDDRRYLVAACTPCNLKAGEPAADPAPAPSTRW